MSAALPVPRAPRVPRAVAVRMDRAARAAHWFHRFAHHPLCDQYASELVALGHRARVCRGCLSIALGLVLGLIAGAVLRGSAAAVGVAPLALAVFALVPGRSKLLRRLVPAAALGCAFGHGPWPVSALAAAIFAAAWLTYLRRGPHRAPCASCPQRTREICDGYLPLYRRERALQRLTGRWLRG